ncbi:unnamed protein product [Caretta caretta]
MAELELVGGYRVLAPLAKEHMETGDFQAELTVAVVAHNFTPGNGFIDVAEFVPGFVSSKKGSCAESPRGEGEVTCAAGKIGECLFNSSVAAGMIVTSSFSPRAQGKSLQEGLDRASSSPVIISLVEGNVPPCNRKAFPAADCQEVAGQQGTGPVPGCTETCIPEMEVWVLTTAVVGTDPKGSVAGSKPNLSEWGEGGDFASQ